MPTREELHALIDSLPEHSFDSAQQLLTRLQVWPPEPIRDVEMLRERMRQKMDEFPGKGGKPGPSGKLTSFGGGGHYSPLTASGTSSFSRWDGDTLTTERLHRHKGHDISVVESTRLDGTRLIYEHEVVGPANQRDARKVIFEL